MSNEATSDLQEPAAAALLVEYQPGSVVSRTVLKKSGGTVTLFAFDAGEGLSEHTTPHEALLLGLEGAADIYDPTTLGLLSRRRRDGRPWRR